MKRAKGIGLKYFITFLQTGALPLSNFNKSPPRSLQGHHENRQSACDTKLASSMNNHERLMISFIVIQNTIEVCTNPIISANFRTEVKKEVIRLNTNVMR